MSSVADWILLAALLVVVLLTPVFGLREWRRLMQKIDLGNASARARVFAKNIVWQWGMSGVLLVGWLFTTYTPQSVFLVPGWTGWEWLAVGLGILGCGLAVGQTIMLRGKDARLAKIADQLGDVIALAPRTAREQRLFDGLSLTAGVCEEFIYRGLLLGVLASSIGLWPAVAVSTILFGLAHSYQGVGGGIRTGIFGAVAALLTVYSGSIYVAVALHAILDLSQGRMIAMAVQVSPGTTPGQPPAALKRTA